MHLSDFDLQQLDEQKLKGLSVEQKEALLVKLLWDLHEARERLKTNSQTSSRPPSSDAPWQGRASEAEDLEESESASAAREAQAGGEVPTEPSSEPEPTAGAAPDPAANPPKKPGRRVGAPGPSRQLCLPISDPVVHRPEACVRWGQVLEPDVFQARTGWSVLDVERTGGDGLQGLAVRHDKHLYGEVSGPCGHVNRTEPARCPAEPLWEVELSEWPRVGPMLLSLMVCLSQRLRLSRRRIKEFLGDWLGVELSISTINQCSHEAGRAVAPIEEQRVDELQQALLAYADETPWKEWGQLLWLWVITTPTVCLYFIGYRSQEILANAFGKGFVGWLMSDGYPVYRRFRHRLRCWAHLQRKAKGLKDRLNAEARAFGQATDALLNNLMKAIDQAREGPPRKLTAQFQDRLDAFARLCEQHRDSAHGKTRALAREFLNDWEAIGIVVAHPYRPLTNNEAERALRHWVIARRISQGTRTEQGSRVVALLASVIDTCRKRNVLPWPYLAQLVAERRKSNPAPPLPAAS